MTDQEDTAIPEGREHFEKDESSIAQSSQKIDIEIKLLQLQLDEYKGKQKFENWKSIASFITTTVAVVALFFSIYQQNTQSALVQQQHIDDTFNKDIQQFASSLTVSSKLISISKLATYFQAQYNQYHNQLSNLFITYIEADSSAPVRALIQKNLVDNASERTLNMLLDQNRALIHSLQLFHIDENEANLRTEDSLSPAATAAITNLEWNINTIIRSMNVLKWISDIDFSNTILSMNSLTSYDTGDWDGKHLTGTELKRQMLIPLTQTLLSGLSFKRVRFTHAFLSGLSFSSDTFKNVSFDSSFLIGSNFTDCIFQDSCRFSNFYTSASFSSAKVGMFFLIDNYTSFIRCKIKLTHFSPRPFSNGESSAYNMDSVFKSNVNFFSDSEWNIDSIGSLSKKYYAIDHTGKEK